MAVVVVAAAAAAAVVDLAVVAVLYRLCWHRAALQHPADAGPPTSGRKCKISPPRLWLRLLIILPIFVEHATAIALSDGRSDTAVAAVILEGLVPAVSFVACHEDVVYSVSQTSFRTADASGVCFSGG